MSEGIVAQASLITVNESNENVTPEQSILTPDPVVADRKKFMEDEIVKQWVYDNVAMMLPAIRNDWKTIRAEWQLINNMIAMEMEENASYKGETEVYLPTFINALETRVAHVKKASFPTDSYMDVIALKQESPEDIQQRDANKAWMRRQIETHAKLRANLGPFVRNVLAYGFGIIKGYWEDCLKHQKKGKYKDAALASILSTKPKKYIGKCRVKTVNNFTFYAYPLSVDELDQCTIVFEDIQLSKQFVQNMVAKGYWKESDIVYSSSNNDSEEERQKNLLDNTKTSQTAISGGISGDLGSYTEVSEVWFSMVLPEKYHDAETIAAGDHVDPVPMKAIICGGNIVDIQENPFNHGKHPYLSKKLVKTPDVLVSPGYGKWVMKSQFLVNDLANQLNDNGIYGLNPIVIRDPTKMAGHSLSQTISPGAIFDGEDGCLKFERPDVNGIQWGSQLLDRAVSIVNDTIAPPILQGSSSGGAAKTATGAQLLQSNTKTDIQDFNEDLEQEVLIPLMEMFHSLGQQFESEEMFLAITGKDKIRFSPEMLAMDLSWQWVASSQTINQQVRGQQMQLFLQAILNPQVVQSLMVQGKQLNVEPVLRKMWEDALGQRSFESLFIKPMAPGMPGLGGGMPMPGGMQPSLSPEQISTTSQNPTNGGVMPNAPVQGEGEMFRNVRTEAEGMSGPMGILGNLPKQ